MVRVIGDAAFVPLTRKHQSAPRRYALVDIEDYERVTRSKWGLDGRGYARATTLKFLAAHHRRMHAYVLRVQPGERIDHINGDTLDNRKQNLRLATAAQNSRNSRRPNIVGKTSRFKGVCWTVDGDCWLANITADGQQHRLGRFSSEEDAARAYDEAALRLFGEFARTNEMMKLFEMDDPFTPNCSKAKVYDRRARLSELTPHWHRMFPAPYELRLTDRLRRELAEAKAAG